MAHVAFDAKSDVRRNTASELPVRAVSGSVLISTQTVNMVFALKNKRSNDQTE